jgi:hypothetical protein
MNIIKTASAMVAPLLLSGCLLDIPEESVFIGEHPYSVRDFAPLGSVILDSGVAEPSQGAYPEKTRQTHLMVPQHSGLHHDLTLGRGDGLENNEEHRLPRNDGDDASAAPDVGEDVDAGSDEFMDDGGPGENGGFDGEDADVGLDDRGAPIPLDTGVPPDAEPMEDVSTPDAVVRLDTPLPECPLVDNDCRQACVTLNEYAFDTDHCIGLDEYNPSTRNLMLIRCISNCNQRHATTIMYCGHRAPNDVLEDRRTLEIGFRNACRGSEQQDHDGDGYDYPFDNCPAAANPLQTDSDGDNIGDICDNCRNTHNTQQRDDDRNGLGNACTIEP